jgi:hypothetical protein
MKIYTNSIDETPNIYLIYFILFVVDNNQAYFINHDSLPFQHLSRLISES